MGAIGQGTQPIRVIIADDIAPIRAGIRRFLRPNPSIKVVAEACNGLEALEALEQTSADILLLDASMPVMDGYAVIEAIHQMAIRVKVLVVTAHIDYTQELIGLNVDGYLLKDDVPDCICDAVTRIAGGGKWFSPSLTNIYPANR